MARKKKNDRSAFSLRMPKALMDRLVKDAKKQRRSINTAINTRLEESFGRAKQLDDNLGGPRAVAFWRALAAIAAFEGGGDRWLSDHAAWTAVRKAWQAFLDHAAPPVASEHQQEDRT